MFKPLPLRYSHYRVFQHPDGTPWKLGAGAMGVTYKAYDERLRIEVALKLIHPMRVDDPKAQSLFLREARAAARIRHPNVASVLFLNDSPGEFFYAMEFVAGQSLQDAVRERVRLPLLTALSIATQIARGLDAIHAEGIIHRDLKPANLMLLPARRRLKGEVLPDWKTWQAKIIDFGLARTFEGESLDDDSVAQTTGFRGTVVYASPEQCDERTDLDGRSDLYSLGCILWELLLGAPPFQGKSQHEVMSQHLSRPPALSRLSSYPESVQAVIARLLIKDPGGRFATAEATAKALDRCIDRIGSGEESRGAAPEPPPFLPAKSPPTTPSDPAPEPAEVTPLSAPAARSAERSAFAPAPTIEGRGLRGRSMELAAFALALLLLGVLVWQKSRPVVPPGSDGATGGTTATPPAGARTVEKSIAVLPFENLSEEKNNGIFTNGIQDEILTDLARVSDLKVISRSSVMQYRSGEPRNLRDIGRALGIAYVLEGSVKRAGDRIRVTVQLVDTRSNAQIWAGRFEPPLADIFALQAEIAGTVVKQLQAKLTPAEQADISLRPTSDLRAYELYLTAKDLIFSGAGGRGAEGARAMREAQGLLSEAVARDPAFFHAHCLLAYCHDNLFWYGNDPTAGRLALAQASIENAAKLRPDAGELHQARALHSYWGSRDYGSAATEIALANKRLPNNAAAFSLRGYIDRRQGRFDDAIVNLEKAAELSPREVVPAYDLAESYNAARRGADFFRVMDHLAELSPREQRIRLYRAYGGHLMLVGDPKPLQELLEGYQRDNPANFTEYAPYAFALAVYLRHPAGADRAAAALKDDWTVWNGRRFPKAYYDGVRAHYFGKPEEAWQAFNAARVELERRLWEVPDEDRSLMALAYVHAFLGQNAPALDAARRAMAICPLSKDAVAGANHAQALSEIQALIGDREAALTQLEKLVSIPFGLDYGDLVHSPIWDGFRKEPRFRAVLERVAPKPTAK